MSDLPRSVRVVTDQAFPEISAVPLRLREDFEAAFHAQQQATLATWRMVRAAWDAAATRDKDFVDDELALIMNVHPATAEVLLADVMLAAPFPALLTEWEAGHLTDRHVKAACKELYDRLTETHQRTAVLDRVLQRCHDRAAQGHSWPKPGELGRMIAAAALLLDLDAAHRQEREAADRRGVDTTPLPHGQAQLVVEGPQEQVLEMATAIRARAEEMGREPGDERTLAQREFDAAHELITSGAAGEGTVTRETQVVVPVATATGEADQLGELPGLGPVHPQTCRDLLSRSDTLRRICVDATTGRVLAVDDPVRVGRDPAAIAGTLAAMQTDPVVTRDLSTPAYRPTRRALAFVRTRDRTCRFPGCTRPARRSDVDHEQPWPLGPTDPANLHCLCRHHHRAKQSGLFSVRTEPDGTTVWTLRGGREFRRPPPALLPSC
jgi:hypothetical protein